MKNKKNKKEDYLNNQRDTVILSFKSFSSISVYLFIRLINLHCIDTIHYIVFGNQFIKNPQNFQESQLDCSYICIFRIIINNSGIILEQLVPWEIVKENSTQD